MNDLESQLREELLEVAAGAPSPERVRTWFNAQPSPPRAPRYRRAPVLLAGAAAAVVLSAGAVMAGQLTDSPPAAHSPTVADQRSVVRDAETEQAVDRFVQAVIARHPDQITPSVDWAAATIRLTATGPLPDDVVALRGDDIGGLTVVVATAVVSRQAYEALIEATKSVTFANKDRIRSFSLPADASSIQANVTRLHDMSTSEVADLKASLQSLTPSPVTLAQAIDLAE